MLYIAAYGDDYEPQAIHGVFTSRAFAELSLEEATRGYPWQRVEIIEAELDTPI